MKNLIEPKNTIAVLKKWDINFKKKFGQNFLIDAHVLGKIIDAAAITKEDTVLEIGPGIGTLTEALALAAGHVYAVEIDGDLIPILEENLTGAENVTILHNDILKVDLRELFLERKKRFKVVANLPYYITTPILMNLLESGAPIESITVMVQKEVADRMSAGPGGKDYGALSLAVQYYAEPYLVANVPPNCFMPRPDVASAVIRLTRYEKPPVAVMDEKQLFALIRASFQVRRKTLFNGIKNAGFLGYSKEQVERAISSLGKGESVRGETLNLAEFAALSDALSLENRTMG